MKKVDKYQKLYDSLKEAHEVLRNELERWKTQCITLQAERSQWEAEKVKQQMIIQQALANSNQTNNRYLEEIKELRQQVERLKGGPRDGSIS